MKEFFDGMPYETSLLDLLQKEKEATIEVNYYRNSIDDFLLNAGRKYDAESALRLANEYKEKMKIASEKLASIRKEMNRYLPRLMDI